MVSPRFQDAILIYARQAVTPGPDALAGHRGQVLNASSMVEVRPTLGDVVIDLLSSQHALSIR
jgi:hypothetical protein